ncbi:hypothetical protein GCM10009632_43920 [Mycolicibacterium alvei]|uniref:TNT domain-containing protein n=2 Tax=Mycolicibacterium alvei TaxID=67081 RepID=A0A6N4URC3_9MYCO|nr:hypothetical protein MALV_13390 [Mycolicibacterium alvei]
MTLSMADVDHWDPGQIDEVSDALVDRARHSGTAADELRGAQAIAEWDGEAGEAAKQALEKSAVEHDSSAQNDVLAAMAAKKSSGDVRAVKSQQKSILEDAAATPAVAINLETNTITPPDTTGWEGEDVQQLADKMRDLEDRIVALLAAAQESDENLSRVMTAAGGGDPQSPAEQGARGADPAGMLSELQHATDQAIVDQMAKIHGIQKQLDDALKNMYVGRPGSSEFDTANNTARKLRGELATALNDLGNIPDYSLVDPKSITVFPDGHFQINTTENGVPYQVYGQLKNGTGEFFDQAKRTAYTFKGGTLDSTNTLASGKVTPDDELLFNAVTTAVGAPEAVLAAKGLGQAGIHGFKALLGREAFESFAGVTGENVIPKALVAAEARADDAAANLAGHHPPPTLDRPSPPPVDNLTPAAAVREQPLPGPAGEHPTPAGSVGEHPAPVAGGVDHHPSPIGASPDAPAPLSRDSPLFDDYHPADPGPGFTNADGGLIYPDDSLPSKPYAIPGTVIDNAEIPQGTVVDRFGYPGGSWMSPDGVPFAERALPPGSAEKPYYQYVVDDPTALPPGWHIEQSQAAPWFHQPGGGTQYRIVAPEGDEASVETLVDWGFLKEMR